MSPYREFLVTLFSQVVAAADPEELVRSRGAEIQRFCKGERPLVLTVGKAAVAMARAIPTPLPQSLITSLQSDRPTELLTLPSDHPRPTQRSIIAAQKTLAAISACPASTPIVLGLSGGASAAWCLPSPPLSLADIVETNRICMNQGASIQQLNCVRRHLSAIKGGQLALFAAPRPVLTLALVDVVAGQPHDVGSGPGSGDPTTFADTIEVLRQLGVQKQIPRDVLAHLRRGTNGAVKDTPLPDHPALQHNRYLPVGDPQLLQKLALTSAQQQGWQTHSPQHLVTGPVEALAKRLVTWIGGAPKGQVAVFAGEPTIRLPAKPGIGGRAHHTALLVLRQLWDSRRNWALLAAGSDGIDGSTAAAGAIVDGSLRTRTSPAQIDTSLQRADSGTLLRQLSAQLTPGATGTNLTDIYVAVVGE